jgi:two-component system, OmpR family, sensor kinase
VNPANWSLRARLLAELLALLAVACLVIGVVSELALRDFLLHQLDAKLIEISHRGGDRGPRDGGRPPPPPPDNPDFLANGSLSAQVAGGSVLASGYVDGGQVLTVPTEQQATLVALPADGRPRTVSLGPLGEYRVVANPAPSGATIVTGQSMADLNDTLLRLALIVTAVAIGALVLAGGAGAVIVRLTLRPLRRMADTASRVAELPLDRGEVALSVRVPDSDTNPRTEVGKVGTALNRMLGHVGAALAARQASETRVRQFVADASHELRTPLAAIRGYAELTRRSTDEVPPDIAYALGRVESESARMTTLVNDLLLLARLDSAEYFGADPRGAPAREPVDLSRLVVDTTSDAHAAAPDHHWQLDLPEESITVPGDEPQLHHVLGNLLSNARTHTPAGTTVTVRLTTEDGHAVLSVADNGPGIPPDLLPDVFDRFARGDSARTRATGSTGLGLAIVAAVVAAHHGTVTADSRPGLTTFTVRLPL